MILNIEGRPVNFEFSTPVAEDLMARLRLAMYEKTMFYLSNGKEYAIFHPKLLYAAYTEDKRTVTHKGPEEFAFAISTSVMCGYNQFGDEAAMEQIPAKKIKFIFQAKKEEAKPAEPPAGKIILLN